MGSHTVLKIDVSRPLPAGTVCGWDLERIYTPAKQYFDSLLNDIESAVSSIELLVYIFSLDTIGLRVMDALLRASQRQVRVRLLVDGVVSCCLAGCYESSVTGCEHVRE